MDRGDIAEKFRVAKTAGEQRARALQSAGMPILTHGPMFAAGPPELTNPLVRQLLTARKELLVPDGNTRPVSLQGRAGVFTKNSKDLDAVMIQPTRNEGLVFTGRYRDTPSGLMFIPGEMVPLSPKLDVDFTYARNAAIVLKVYSSTRSTSNSLLQGTLDAVSLFDYRDLTSSSRAAIMKAAPGDNSYVVGVPAAMGVTITLGPEGIPDEFNQPVSITGRDDRGSDLKYDWFSYRTIPDSKIKWSGSETYILHLQTSDGTLVPNLINAPVKIQGICTADAAFVLMFRVSGHAATKNHMDDKGEYLKYTLWDYYPSTAEKTWPGTGGPFFGTNMNIEYSPEVLAKSMIQRGAATDIPINLPFIITEIELIIGKFGDVGAETGNVHWSSGSLIIPGYFGCINGPTSVVLLNGFDDECSSSCGQSVEIQVSQLVEATPSGSLNQYIDPSSSLQRFSDSSMLSLAMVAFNTGADGLRRAWVGSAYNEYISSLSENRKQVGTVLSTLQAAGPLGELGRHLGGMLSGLPIIGGLAKPALSGLGDLLDNTLFSAGMPGGSRTGFAAGPESPPENTSTSDDPPAKEESRNTAGQSKEADGAMQAEATMQKLICLETPGISAFTDQTYSRGPMGQYQYAMKQLTKNRVAATLIEWGTTPEEIAETLTELYKECEKTINECDAPDPLLLKVKGGLAKTVLETIRCTKGLPPIHSSPEAIGILNEPVLSRRLRTGLCAGSTFSPNGIRGIRFGEAYTPPNQVAADAAMSLHVNNFMEAMQNTLTGRSTFSAEGQWARYAYFPVMEMVGSEVLGSVETIIISSQPVMDKNSQGQNIPATYRSVRYIIQQNEGTTDYMIRLEGSFLPANIKEATPDETACLTNIGHACYFTGVPQNSHVSCPAFDKVVGPSLGLAVAAASLGLNTDAVYTGGLAPQQYPGSMLVTDISYLPAKISAAGKVNKMLICPNQADANNVLLNDQLNQGLFASISDIIAGKAQRTVSAIIVNTLSDAILASASLRFARKAEKRAPDENVIAEQRRLADEQATLGDAFKRGDPSLINRTWPVRVSERTYDIPLFDIRWWKQHSGMFGPGPRQIKVTPATLRSHMEHGSYKRLLGLASQVQARALAANKTKGSGSQGGALTRVGQEVRMRRSGILQPSKRNPQKRPRQTGTEDADWSWGGEVRTTTGPTTSSGKRSRQGPASPEYISDDEDFGDATDNPTMELSDYGV